MALLFDIINKPIEAIILNVLVEPIHKAFVGY